MSALQVLRSVLKYAYEEGEGDRSLEHRRRVHRESFKKELEEQDHPFYENVLVVFRPSVLNLCDLF
jgi:uncharacterized protein YhfF